MHRRMTAWVGLAAMAVVAVTLGGCAAAPSRDELVHALELTGIPAERAECAADAVLENLSDDEVTELVERGPAGAPRDDPDRTDDTSDEVRAALAACQQVGATTTTSPTSSTTTPAPENQPTTTAVAATTLPSTTPEDASSTTSTG